MMTNNGEWSEKTFKNSVNFFFLRQSGIEHYCGLSQSSARLRRAMLIKLRFGSPNLTSNNAPGIAFAR